MFARGPASATVILERPFFQRNVHGMRPVRVRFAPSPTGYLHIGGLRTALYNYLFARHYGGAFLLRVEDTDRERLVEDAEADIISSLEWAGLAVDEGPERGGPFGPYRQSERREIYRRYAMRLIDSGRAYFAFDTPEELDAMRSRAATDPNVPAQYDARTRHLMKNALTLSAEEVARRLDAGEAHVVRLKVEPGQTVGFQDAVRGQVSFDTSTLDDQVLVKSDGMPTYHLANVVDDHLMEITHVIRGEEWLPSTPKHVLLYEYFGWHSPAMAHLPLILSPGGGKLSKRDADRSGIPVSVRDYRADGYEPRALLNFLAFLGWNPGDEREILDLDDLIDAFSLDRVGSSGVQFNMDKLRWYNQQYVKSLAPEVLAERVMPEIAARGWEAERAYVAAVAALMQERIVFASELPDAARYFFEDPQSYDEDGLRKRWKDDSPEILRAYTDRLAGLQPFDQHRVEEKLRELADERHTGAGRIIHPVRLALSGVTAGPGLFEMMAVLGRDTCIRRLRTAVEKLG